MKTGKLICTFLFTLVVTAATSQDFTGGLKAGFNLSQIDGDGMKGYHKGGLIFGAFINRELSSTLKWQMEMFYIGRGSKEVTKVDSLVVGYKRIAVNYIEVPLLLQFWAERYKTNFELGLSFSTLVNSKEENEDGVTTFIGPFRRFGVGTLIGFNYAFGDRLSGTARFTYSLSPIAVENKVLFTVWNRFGGSYNNVIEVVLNYHINSKD